MPPLPRRSPPPITPGSGPRYMIWLEQPYSRPFDFGGAWAGGWLSLLARSGQSERCGQSPNDGISSWRPLSAWVTPKQSFITQRKFQRVSSFRWPRRANLIFLEHCSRNVTSLFHRFPQPRLKSRPLTLARRPPPTMPASFPASREHLCSGEVSRQRSASLLQAFPWAVSQLGTPPYLSR